MVWCTCTFSSDASLKPPYSALVCSQLVLFPEVACEMEATASCGDAALWLYLRSRSSLTLRSLLPRSWRSHSTRSLVIQSVP